MSSFARRPSVPLTPRAVAELRFPLRCVPSRADPLSHHRPEKEGTLRSHAPRPDSCARGPLPSPRNISCTRRAATQTLHTLFWSVIHDNNFESAFENLPTQTFQEPSEFSRPASRRNNHRKYHAAFSLTFTVQRPRQPTQPAHGKGHRQGQLLAPTGLPRLALRKILRLSMAARFLTSGDLPDGWSSSPCAPARKYSSSSGRPRRCAIPDGGMRMPSLHPTCFRAFAASVKRRKK